MTKFFRGEDLDLPAALVCIADSLVATTNERYQAWLKEA